MNYPPDIWNQLKNKSPDDFIRALKKDGWIFDTSSGSSQAYFNPQTGNRVTIHLHPGKIYGRDMLQMLIKDIGWSVEDMKRIKFVK